MAPGEAHRGSPRQSETSLWHPLETFSLPDEASKARTGSACLFGRVAGRPTELPLQESRRAVDRAESLSLAAKLMCHEVCPAAPLNHLRDERLLIGRRPCRNLLADLFQPLNFVAEVGQL